MFTHRYATELPDTFTHVMPRPLAKPYWVGWNERLAKQLQLPLQPNDDMLQVMSGRALFEGLKPLAQKYAGHQFGGWNPDLGDGRGLLLGEWQDPEQNQWELHLKGAGQTPYSRFGDGRAVLRSSIREFLGSEALHALGIASTRALAIIGSEEPVQRETIETGATLLRVSPSHIRFGHFEWFSFSNKTEQLQHLTDFVIRHHYPACQQHPEPVLALLDAVIERTAKMIAGWMAYGFVHGVMNTDNMSILGETFDYGPYAFLDATQMDAVFNHTDAGGRYAFNQQADIGLWNLQRLAQALSVLANPRELALGLSEYKTHYQKHYYALMNVRLGGDAQASISETLIDEWVQLLASEQKDFHLPFRWLAEQKLADWPKLKDEFIDRDRFSSWCVAIQLQVIQDDEKRLQQMQQTNPVSVARTHHLQTVIESAEAGDFEPFESLFAALSSPFENKEQWQRWQTPPENSAPISLSCSS